MWRMPSTWTPGEIDLVGERDGGEQRELVRGVDAIDVEARIGFGITEALRLGQNRGEIAARFAHLRQDVIAGAVEDAVDAEDVVRAEPFAQRLQDRNAARHRGLEAERDALVLGETRERGAVMGQQGLIGGDDVLAVLQRGGDDPTRHPVAAADQLDHDIDTGQSGHRHRILVPRHAGKVDAAGPRAVARRYRGELERPPGMALQQGGIAPQQRHRPGADRAETGDGNSQRRDHGATGCDKFAALATARKVPPRCRCDAG